VCDQSRPYREPDESGQITNAEALVAIQSVFAINSLALAPLDDHFIKLVPTAQVRSEAPELVVGSLRDEPPSGKIVSKLFRLQYLDPALFQSQMGPFLSGFGFVVPFQNSSTVVVTDTVSNLQRLEYLVKGIAVTPVRYALLVFELVTIARFAVDMWVTGNRRWRK